MFNTSSKLLIASLAAAIVLSLGFALWSGQADAARWKRVMSAHANASNNPSR